MVLLGRVPSGIICALAAAGRRQEEGKRQKARGKRFNLFMVSLSSCSSLLLHPDWFFCQEERSPIFSLPYSDNQAIDTKNFQQFQC